MTASGRSKFSIEDFTASSDFFGLAVSYRSSGIRALPG